MRCRGRREGLEGRRPGRAVVGRVRVRVGVAVRGRMGMSRVRRRWPMGVEVRIILIHHIGAAHHPARARHPRAGLQTRVAERRTTPANDTTPSTRRLPARRSPNSAAISSSSNDPRTSGATGTVGPALRTIRMERQMHSEFRQFDRSINDARCSSASCSSDRVWDRPLLQKYVGKVALAADAPQGARSWEGRLWRIAEFCAFPLDFCTQTYRSDIKSRNTNDDIYFYVWVNAIDYNRWCTVSISRFRVIYHELLSWELFDLADLL